MSRDRRGAAAPARGGPRPTRRSVWGAATALGALLLAGAGQAALGLGTEAPAIRVNQLGYRPGDPKVALVAGAPAGFAVRDAATQRIVFEGKAGAPGSPDPASGDRVAALDFSPLTAPGAYVVTAPGVAPSPPFRVGASVYADALPTVLRTFPAQRCGAAIRDGSPFARPACHLLDAVEWGRPGVRRDVTGGWHDAGDYGKYVPAAGVTLWHLAALHAQAPPRIRDGELVPPANGIPDLLEEMRWELDWLLRMQRADGGVHHKVTVARWTGDRMPHEDRDERYLFGVSSVATATLAAVAAQSARLFRPHDPAYATRLVGAAEAAWRWLERHPDIVPAGGFTNPPGVETGVFDDPDDRDDRFWAAVELWRATGGGQYRQRVLASLDRWPAFDYPASWRNVHNLGLLTLLEPESPLEPATHARLRAALVERGGWVVQAVGRDGYRVALTLRDYYWGSNGVVVGRAVLLLAAFRETGRAPFRDAALDQLHYVLGRNALGKSFVTGLGANSVRRPYYQPTLGHPGRPVLPGLLVGGPNAQEKGVPAPFPARAYRDEYRLYGVNEPGIYWTSVLAYVLGAFADGG